MNEKIKINLKLTFVEMIGFESFFLGVELKNIFLKPDILWIEITYYNIIHVKLSSLPRIFLSIYRSLPSTVCYEILPVKTKRWWDRVQCTTNWASWTDRTGPEPTPGTLPTWGYQASLPRPIPTNPPPPLG